MDVLIAEDDIVSMRALDASLSNWGYQTVLAEDGEQAWTILQDDCAPSVAVLDWMMPKLDGVEVCQRVRDMGRPMPTYMLLLSARSAKGDIITGLESGADDYITKPVDLDELRARLHVAERIVDLQHRLANQVVKLEEALGNVKQLQGMLPICSYCKKIRDDRNYWQQVESYITDHTLARFSHSICPTCMDEVVKPHLASVDKYHTSDVDWP